MSHSPDPVKDLAKELAKESAKKIKSSVLSIFGLNKDSPSVSPGTSVPQTNNQDPRSARVYDLSENLASLSLGGRVHPQNQTPAHPPFLGDFDAELSRLPSPYDNVERHTRRIPDGTIPASLIPGQRRVSMPIPQTNTGTSLTMQYALDTPIADRRPYQGPSVFGLDTPPSRPHSTSRLPQPDFGLQPSPLDVSCSTVAARRDPKRSRSASTPPSPLSATALKNGGTQCSGVTKAGKRCTRVVKSNLALSYLDPNTDAERFCHQHVKEVFSQTGFYSRKAPGVFIDFTKIIPSYLQQDTQAALRTEMEKPRSIADVAGWIYTFEIRDLGTPDQVKLKVGRAVNIPRRIDQWGKQCGSKEQILRGYWPEPKGGDVRLMKGVALPDPAERTPSCHRLERLIHLELADLSVNAPYLLPGFPHIKGPDNDITSGSTSGKSTAAKKAHEKPCNDCGQVHKEIFVFTRVESGRLVGREWEDIVKPVIQRWGDFVKTHV